jgi:hypothetical protein
MEQAESLIRLYWYVRQINLQDIAGEPRGNLAGETVRQQRVLSPELLASI